MLLDVDIQFKFKEFVSLWGKSGAGKTTILKMIAGLMKPDEGLIQIDDEVWFDSNRRINLPPQKRRIGYVFQEPTLFPHMNVRENCVFALDDNKDIKMLDELLELMNLRALEHSKPHALSGGQKQRVALIRALLRRPKILLLDEPFSALDLELRSHLQDEINQLYKRFETTIIFVSHDIAEVYKLSHHVFQMEFGHVIKSGAPSELWGGENLSGKFKFIGQICDIYKDGVVHVVTVQIGVNMTKVIATDEEIKDLKIGSKVMVAAKAFNPIIVKY